MFCQFDESSHCVFQVKRSRLDNNESVELVDNNASPLSAAAASRYVVAIVVVVV